MPQAYTATMHPATWVREVQTEDGAALLDIRNGICLSLTPVAVEIWRRLKVHFSQQEILVSLRAQFPEVPEYTLRDDLAQYLEDLRDRGLLVDAEDVIPSSSVPRLLRIFQSGHHTESLNGDGTERLFSHLTANAFIGLLLFDLLSFRGKFVGVHNAVKDWPTASICAPADTVERVCAAVNYACSWYPKRVLCLQRAALTTCLLRRCGIDARMVIGAQRLPFKAHAWTEVNGIAVNERRAVTEMYLVWERC